MFHTYHIILHSLGRVEPRGRLDGYVYLQSIAQLVSSLQIY